MNVTKILAVVIPAGAVATFAVPAVLNKQRRTELTEQFQPALKTYDKINIPQGGKQGTLAWPDTVSSLDPSELPTIPGGIFVMQSSESYVTGSRLHEKPAKIHDSFFELDDAVRASSPSDVRTLVHAKVHHLTTNYKEEDGGPAVVRILNQRVITLHIYDLQEGTCVGVWNLAGQRPPHGFRANKMPDLAPPPSVAKFLEALPRR
jgi:hypothetical protein